MGGFVALLEGDDRGGGGDEGEGGDGGDRGGGEATGASLLVDVVALEVVLGDVVDGCGEVGDGGAEAAVAEVELGVVACPAEVEPAWFVVERVDQCGGEAGGEVGVDPAGVDPAGLGEGEGAVGDDDEEVVEGFVGEPGGDLALDPVGSGRFG